MAVASLPDGIFPMLIMLLYYPAACLHGCLETAKLLARCFARAFGLLEKVGGAESPLQHVQLVGIMVDLQLEKPDISELQLRLEATRAAQQLGQAGLGAGLLAGAAAVPGAIVAAGAAGVAGAGGERKQIQCYACNKFGHYSNACPDKAKTYNKRPYGGQYGGQQYGGQQYGGQQYAGQPAPYYPPYQPYYQGYAPLPMGGGVPPPQAPTGGPGASGA